MNPDRDVVFANELYLVKIDESRDQLIRAFRLYHGRRLITLPRGFVTDYDSVPRLPLAYWLLGGKRHKAAVVHDFLYSNLCPYWLASLLRWRKRPHARGRADRLS